MKIHNLQRGLEILKPYCVEMDMVVKPHQSSVSNTSPFTYLYVEVDFRKPVPPEGDAELKSLGWCYEDAGTDYWLFKNWS